MSEYVLTSSSPNGSKQIRNSDKRKGVHSEKRFKMSMQVTSQCVQGKLKAKLDERDVVKAGHIYADSFLIRQWYDRQIKEIFQM